MNGRVAKRLRREAERRTQGRPARGWLERVQRFKTKDDTWREKFYVFNDPTHTRGVYLRLKKEHRCRQSPPRRA